MDGNLEEVRHSRDPHPDVTAKVSVRQTSPVRELHRTAPTRVIMPRKQALLKVAYLIDVYSLQALYGTRIDSSDVVVVINEFHVVLSITFMLFLNSIPTFARHSPLPGMDGSVKDTKSLLVIIELS